MGCGLPGDISRFKFQLCVLVTCFQ